MPGTVEKRVAMATEDKNKATGSEALTSIEMPIHCAATPEEVAQREQDEIDITNFINALAEVAIAVARRRRQGNQ